eukprot:g38665.t1
MEYNVEKCEVMHFDGKNRGTDYFLNGEKIQKSEVQRDLEVLVQDFLKCCHPWNQPANQISRNAVEEEFLERILDGVIDQYVEEPTREQAIFDWVLSNKKGTMAYVVVHDTLGMSEYNMIEFLIKMESVVVDLETRVLNFNKGNYEDMRRQLALIDRGELFKGMTVI